MPRMLMLLLPGCDGLGDGDRRRDSSRCRRSRERWRARAPAPSPPAPTTGTSWMFSARLPAVTMTSSSAADSRGRSCLPARQPRPAGACASRGDPACVAAVTTMTFEAVTPVGQLGVRQQRIHRLVDGQRPCTAGLRWPSHEIGREQDLRVRCCAERSQRLAEIAGRNVELVAPDLRACALAGESVTHASSATCTAPASDGAMTHPANGFHDVLPRNRVVLSVPATLRACHLRRTGRPDSSIAGAAAPPSAAA